jgi:hypothetical protein
MPSENKHFENFGRKLDEGAQRLEQEGEKFIKYFNDEVVPAIRSKSGKALRVAADKLTQLASYMEQKTQK